MSLRVSNTFLTLLIALTTAPDINKSINDDAESKVNNLDKASASLLNTSLIPGPKLCAALLIPLNITSMKSPTPLTGSKAFDMAFPILVKSEASIVFILLKNFLTKFAALSNAPSIGSNNLRTPPIISLNRPDCLIASPKAVI